MAVNIQQINNEPIVVVTFTPPLGNAEELHEASAFVADLKNNFDGTIYRIDVLPDAMPFGMIVDGMATVAAKGISTDGTFADPRVQGIIVGADAQSEMISKGLKQDQYGALNVPLFGTLDDAMDFVRTDMLEEA